MRAFTLLELMVVLAIMIAVGAIVLPLALDDSKRAAMREAQDQLEAALLSARADAQRTSKTIRVIGVMHEGQWILSEEEVLDRTDSGGGEASTATRLIQELVLPQGVRLARTRDRAEGKERETWEPSEESDEDAEEPEANISGDIGVDGVGEKIQVAIFLPDGQIQVTRPLYVGGPDGRVGEVVVNGWTGAVTVRILPARNAELGDELGDDEDGADIGDMGGAGR